MQPLSYNRIQSNTPWLIAAQVTVSLGHEERQRTSDQMRVEERMEIEVGSEAIPKGCLKLYYPMTAVE